MSCSVRTCTNCKRFRPEGISFHWFPKDRDLYLEWLKAINLPSNVLWSRNKFVCSTHFKSDDFLLVGDKKCLQSTSIPSENLSDHQQSGPSLPQASISTDSMISPNEAPRQIRRKRSRFPKTDLQYVWLRLIGRRTDNWIWTKNKVICSEHFKQNDFFIRGGKRFLKVDAVPSQKVGVKSEHPSFDSSLSISVPSTSPFHHSLTSTIYGSSSSTTTDEDVKKHGRKKEIEARIPKDVNVRGVWLAFCDIPENYPEPQARKLGSESQMRLKPGSIASIQRFAKRKHASEIQTKPHFLQQIHRESGSSLSLDEDERTSKILRLTEPRTQTLHLTKKNILRQTKTRRNRSLTKEITSLKNIIAHLIQKSLIAENDGDSMMANLPGNIKGLISQKSNTMNRKYSPELWRYALTLQFYSTVAYKYMRKTWHHLPHPRTLEKWYRVVD